VTPQTIRAVLFDAVGTLIYPDPPVAEVYWRIGQRLGSQQTVAEVGRRFGDAFSRLATPPPACADNFEQESLVTSEGHERRRWQQIVGDVFQGLPANNGDLFQQLWEHFSSADNWALFDDVAETWQALARRGLTLGIASNFDDRLTGICRSLPPLATCTHVFRSAEIGFSKPHPQFFHTVAKRLQLSPQQILLVGDSVPNDVSGARAAGWQAIRLDRHDDATDPMSISRLTQLIDLLATSD
jgi:putative hydrolase of the HAD superfamily